MARSTLLMTLVALGMTLVPLSPVLLTGLVILCVVCAVELAKTMSVRAIHQIDVIFALGIFGFTAGRLMGPSLESDALVVLCYGMMCGLTVYLWGKRFDLRPGILILWIWLANLPVVYFVAT